MMREEGGIKWMKRGKRVCGIEGESNGEVVVGTETRPLWP